MKWHHQSLRLHNLELQPECASIVRCIFTLSSTIEASGFGVEVCRVTPTEHRKL